MENKGAAVSLGVSLGTSEQESRVKTAHVPGPPLSNSGGEPPRLAPSRQCTELPRTTSFWTSLTPFPWALGVPFVRIPVLLTVPEGLLRTRDCLAVLCFAGCAAGCWYCCPALSPSWFCGLVESCVCTFGYVPRYRRKESFRTPDTLTLLGMEHTDMTDLGRLS